MTTTLDTTQRVTAQPVQAPASPPVADAAQATETIQSKLDDSGWFDDVTHDELKDITATLQNLAPAERNAVVSSLSDGQLQKWASEAGSWGTFGTGGLSREEKTELFDTLAEGLDGKNLARVSAAFKDDATQVGDSIASHASNSAKVEFVREMASRVESDPEAAVQVAKAIGGLKGDAASVDAALKILKPSPTEDGKLQAVISAAQQESFTTQSMMGATSSTLSYNVDPLTQLIDAAATGTDAELKAEVFDMSAKVLGNIAETSNFVPGRATIKNDAERKLAESLTGLLSSDTAGVMSALETNHRGGEGLTSYMKEMIDQGRTDELRVMTEQLRRGNDVNADPVAYFAQKDAQGQYRNAATMGYYVGAVTAATQSLNRDIDREASVLKAVFAGSVSGGKDIATNLWLSASAAKALAGVVAGTVGATGVVTTDAIARDLKAGNKNEREVIADLAYPKYPDGRPFEQTDVETAYDAAAGRVIDANGP